MSDLQCAATLLLTGPAPTEPASRPPDGTAGLSVEGRARARALAAALVDARVAMIYCSVAPAAVQTAEVAAAALGAHVRVRADLGGGQATDEQRVAAVLQEVADLHRGESVLVVAESAALAAALRRLAGGRASTVADASAVVEVAADADGWVVRTPAPAGDAAGNNVTRTVE
jgi:broad specificity phosphatase PhoE